MRDRFPTTKEIIEDYEKLVEEIKSRQSIWIPCLLALQDYLETPIEVNGKPIEEAKMNDEIEFFRIENYGCLDYIYVRNNGNSIMFDVVDEDGEDYLDSTNIENIKNGENDLWLIKYMLMDRAKLTDEECREVLAFCKKNGKEVYFMSDFLTNYKIYENYKDAIYNIYRFFKKEKDIDYNEPKEMHPEFLVLSTGRVIRWYMIESESDEECLD